MPRDIRSMSEWHQKISEFRDFCNLHGAEFDFKVFPDGKECTTARLWFRPVKGKEKENGSKS